MEYLGENVCPKILSINPQGYAMEYLHPITLRPDTLDLLEDHLMAYVWSRIPIIKDNGKWKEELKKTINVDIPVWALNGKTCLVHGDCTLDNVLLHPDGTIRITDPIPPQYLNRPSINCIDDGRMLQSFLGWEVVLRGAPSIEYLAPYFLYDAELCKSAIFWCMVTLKRIAAKDTTSAGQWATRIAGELECML
jgi:hypothetical protein